MTILKPQKKTFSDSHTELKEFGLSNRHLTEDSITVLLAKRKDGTKTSFTDENKREGIGSWHLEPAIFSLKAVRVNDF